MKILMVSSFLPYPLITGGNIRLFNIIKRLSQKNEITLVTEIRENQTREDVNEIKKYCTEVYTIKRKKQWTLSNIFRAFFSLDSFLIVGHILPEMKQKVSQLLSTQQFDCIDVETFYVLHNIPETKLPIVLTEHNVEYEAYEKFVIKSIPLVLRPLFMWDVWKMKRSEEQSWNKAKCIMSVSEDEAKIIGHHAIAVPNGYDKKTFTYADPKKKFASRTKRILFIATFKWLQNIDSCTYILKRLWPTVSKNHPDMELWVVGKDIPESLMKIGGDRVVFDSHADDTSQVFHESFALLFPAFVVAGTSLKVIEAMASGLPIVTTPLGVRGLALSNKKDILIGQDDAELIEHISLLATNKKLYSQIAINAREFAEKNYDWDTLMKKVLSVFEELEK